MLLTTFEICVGLIILLLFIVDNYWMPNILFLILMIPSIMEAMIRTFMFSKRLFQCKGCGKSFSVNGYKLFKELYPWKMPIQIRDGKEIESRIYGRSWLKCPDCGSYESVLLSDK